MKRSLVVRNLVSIISGAGLILVACSDQTNDQSGGSTASPVTQHVSELRRLCGNGLCDHHETCSSCPQDCGTCGGTGGTGGAAGTTGAAGTGGSGGTTGLGGASGSTGVCGATAPPPAHYQ